MDAILKRVQNLQQEIDTIWRALKLDDQVLKLAALDAELANPDVWQDTDHAKNLSKQQAKLQASVASWQKIKTMAADIGELSALKDDDLLTELTQQITAAESELSTLRQELRYSGPYDNYDVILSIHAGAGGTDAQDWAAMLLRMYIRFAEQNGFKVTMIEESSGEEAGIKSVTLEISGTFAFGRLNSEHGVHRLVRLSPFNSDNLRQTSFAKVEVMPKIDSPEAVEIDEKDLKIDVYRSGGKGGQSVNTTDSAVRVTHLPTNIVVAIQNERSQLQNKDTAMTILRSKLAQLQLEQHQEDIRSLKGPNEQAAWGNQIRSYVLHPYKQVKDLRTRHESSDPDAVLDGKLNDFIEAYLNQSISN